MINDYLLQMEWDAALVRAWRENRYTFTIAAEFCHLRGVSLDEMRPRLKRFPPEHRATGPVRAFVANWLPALSGRLWDTAMTDAEVVLWLDDAGIDCVKPKPSRRDVQRYSATASAKRTRRVDVHAGHRRSDWGTCKR